MLNNPNLDLLMAKIFDDEKIVDEIMATDDMEELYKLCQKVQGGYTFEEFSEFFDSLVCMCINEFEEAKDIIEESANEASKLSEKELKEISGGAKPFQRMTASAIASVTFLTSAHAYAKDKYDPNLQKNISIVMNQDSGNNNADDDDDDGVPKKKKSFKEKASDFFDKLADGIWDNKGKILLGSLALIGGGAFLVHDHTQIGVNIQTAIDNRNALKDAQKSLRETNIRTKDLPPVKSEADFLREIMDKNPGMTEDNARQLAVEELRKQDLFRSAIDKETSTLNSRISGLQAQKLSDTLTNGLPLVTGITAIGGGIGGVLSGTVDTLNKIRQTADDAEQIAKAAKKAKEWAELAMYKTKMAEQVAKAKNYNFDEGKKKLEENLKSVKGQAKAKDQIKSFFTIYSADMRAAKLGLTDSDLPKAKIIIFNGPSGTGKTYMAKLLCNAFSPIDPYILTANNIFDACKNQYCDIPYAFLYGSLKSDGMGSSDDLLASMRMQNMASFISETQGTIRAVICDEFDKIYRKDTSGKLPQSHPLDETLRDIIDGNLKDPKTGKSIDMSGLLVILTTNETKASLEGRIKVDNYGDILEAKVDESGELVIDESGKQEYITPITDKSGTQTLVPHDGSLMSRLVGNICYFDKLDLDAYEKIARNALEDDRSIKNKDDFFKAGKPNKTILIQRLSFAGLDGVIIPDEGYKLIAEYASKMTNAARSIVGSGNDDTGSVSGNLKVAIATFCADIVTKGGKYKGLTLKATPSIVKNSLGRKEVKFEIESLGKEGYNTYVERLKSN